VDIPVKKSRNGISRAQTEKVKIVADEEHDAKVTDQAYKMAFPK
jgi:hypothetical protein